jgi:hypothetical protein
MRYFAIAMACFAALACSDDQLPTGVNGPVAMTQIVRQKQSGITARRAEVIARETRWVQVWDEITSRQSPKPPLPTVNWDTQLLVLAALGESGDACKDVEIERIDRTDGALVVSILDKSPGANCNPCPPVTVQPVHVVAVPRAAASATYSWRPFTMSCP